MSLRELVAVSRVPALGYTASRGAARVRSLRARSCACVSTADRLRIAVLSTRSVRRRGGAQLAGRRIRMTQSTERIFMRSLATRNSGTESPAALPDVFRPSQIAGLRSDHRQRTPHRAGQQRPSCPLWTYRLYRIRQFRVPSPLEKIRHAGFLAIYVSIKIRRKGLEYAAAGRAQAIPAPRIGSFFSTPAQLPVFAPKRAGSTTDGITRCIRR